MKNLIKSLLVAVTILSVSISQAGCSKGTCQRRMASKQVNRHWPKGVKSAVLAAHKHKKAACHKTKQVCQKAGFKGQRHGYKGHKGLQKGHSVRHAVKHHKVAGKRPCGGKQCSIKNRNHFAVKGAYLSNSKRLSGGGKSSQNSKKALVEKMCRNVKSLAKASPLTKMRILARTSRKECNTFCKKTILPIVQKLYQNNELDEQEVADITNMIEKLVAAQSDNAVVKVLRSPSAAAIASMLNPVDARKSLLTLDSKDLVALNEFLEKLIKRGNN